MVAKEKPANDFNPDELVKSDKHKQDITNIEKRLNFLENRVGDNQKLANTFSEAAKKQTDMEKVFADVFTKLVSKDDAVKNAVKNLINQVDRDAVKTLMKRFGFMIYSGALFIGGLLVKVAIDKYTG